MRRGANGLHPHGQHLRQCAQAVAGAVGFTSNPILQPTNAAEQALRSLVLKRKISGPTRSLRGDQFPYESCPRAWADLREFMRQAGPRLQGHGAAQLDAPGQACRPGAHGFDGLAAPRARACGAEPGRRHLLDERVPQNITLRLRPDSRVT